MLPSPARLFRRPLTTLLLLITALWGIGLFAGVFRQPLRFTVKGETQSASLADTPPSAQLKSADAATQAQVSQVYGKLPLSFEANEGQTASPVRFLSRGSGYSLFLTPTEAVLSLSQPSTRKDKAREAGLDPKHVSSRTPQRQDDRPEQALVRMQLEGSNPQPQVSGEEELPGKTNYFLGNDPEKWRTDVANYAKVRYSEVYPGVDLVYYGNQRQLEYDFVVSPGAETGQIKMGFVGAEQVEVDATGGLVLHTAGGEVWQHKPVIYQEVEGRRKQVAGGYVLRDQREVGFELGEYDVSRDLIIDPVLDYSTYLGGGDFDGGEGTSIAVDAAGCAYVIGLTQSNDFPTENPFQPAKGDFYNSFVTKINASGSALVYSTFLGGSNGGEYGNGIAVDAAGNAYVTGATSSTDFPTKNPLQPAKGGGTDAFISKISPSGSDLVYSTFLGGRFDDQSLGIAVDAAGHAYVTGFTVSDDFPRKNPLQRTLRGSGNFEAFVTKINASGSALIYSTYLGGRNSDIGEGIAVDAAGNAYVTGGTSSTGFPTKNPLQPVLAGGNRNAFVTKINAAGSALVYSTFLGGSGGGAGGFGTGIAVDTAGNAYVTGNTDSPHFPTKNPFQAVFAGGFNDAFVSKISPSGSALVYSTFLGGSSGSFMSGKT